MASRILLIDDCKVERGLLFWLIRGSGRIVSACSTLKDAVNAPKDDYDVVVVDVMLPDANDADDTLRIIRHFGVDRCVVHSSLHESMPEIQQLLAAGVKVVQKAADMSGIKAEITRIEEERRH